jgi:hypothetical protein
VDKVIHNLSKNRAPCASLLYSYRYRDRDWLFSLCFSLLLSASLCYAITQLSSGQKSGVISTQPNTGQSSSPLFVAWLTLSAHSLYLSLYRYGNIAICRQMRSPACLCWTTFRLFFITKLRFVLFMLYEHICSVCGWAGQHKHLLGREIYAEMKKERVVARSLIFSTT